MKFEMWSIWHILYILSPFIIMTILYFCLRNKSEKTKYIIGVVIGTISLAIITTRCIYYYMTHGFHPHVIPLQVCHFGNIVVFIALIFKSKIAASIGFCLNLPAAFSSIILADSLAKYANVFDVLPQIYIWGHLFIVIGALYPIILKEIRIDIKSFLYGLAILFGLLIIAIILNSYFNDVCGKTKDWFVNYFYVYNSKGVPFDFLYKLGTRSQYGWFTINWVYTILLIVIFIPVMYGIYCLQKCLYKKDKEYKTYNIFQKQKAN